ncbi:uncharacterized protein LOC135144081 isoform X2 [Zophobas morio]|uniref:uncharacterized protein LOC135144081 isoform X2 n=1 Tax=Zophobas morio TaxID=2755281 RepID=UPI003083D148
MKTTLIFILLLQLTRTQWIDPHSMDTNHKNRLPNHSQKTSDEPMHNPTAVKECVSDVHLKRLVRIILNSAYLDNDIGYHEGYINIKLTTVEHQFLVNFSQSTKTEDNIFSEVSSIFENALHKPAAERYQELILSMQERIYEILFNPTSTALIGSFLALYLTYKLLKAQFTWKSIVKYFLFLAYIVDCFVTYLAIVRDEEIDNMVNIKKLGTAPPECDTTKMSWWNFLKTQVASTFVENPCKAYYQATYNNYMYLIAPSKVLTRQFRTLVLEPFGDIGEAFGRFGRSMFTTLPWGLNVVLFPVMLVTTVGIVFIIFLFITKPHFKVSLFHLFTIEMGDSATNQAIGNSENIRRGIAFTQGRTRNRRIRGRES